MQGLLIMVISLLHFCSSCVTVITFPENGSQAISNLKDYKSLVEQEKEYKGQSLRMAGRMVGIEKHEQGSKIIAEFMLFPKNPNLRPVLLRANDEEETRHANRNRFLVFYSEPIESQFLWKGNEFLVSGHYTGTEDLVSLFGSSQPVPHIEAQCIHVWQTGSADLQEFTDSPAFGFPYFPPMERTFCLSPVN